MKTGMLWFDNDPKRLPAEKIRRAADYYQNKYGLRPNLVFVNPRDGETEVSGIAVEASKQVLVNHYWVGVRNA